MRTILTNSFVQLRLSPKEPSYKIDELMFMHLIGCSFLHSGTRFGVSALLVHISAFLHFSCAALLALEGPHELDFP